MIRIRRVHMEEDTGKLLHADIDGKKRTLVDFNRSGVPLVEIVTEPDFHSSEEARIFLKKLHQIIRYLGISDADMEKGSMRLEPNISLREISSKNQVLSVKNKLPEYKVEVKNINSFAFVKKAIDFELKRHEGILSEGLTPIQETRGWDEKKQVTVSQRSKEEAHDYRYFPEPDIPPVHWSKEVLAKLRGALPELPDAKIERFVKTYSLSMYDATILCDSQEKSAYFEECVKYKTEGMSAKVIANWLINKKVDYVNLSPRDLVKQMSASQDVSSVTEDELYKIIRKIVEENPKAVQDYKSGKASALMFLTGMVMREVKSPSLAKKINTIIVDIIGI